METARNEIPLPLFISQLLASLLRQFKINRWAGLAGGRFIMGRGILLWLFGVPIPVILLILLFWH